MTKIADILNDVFHSQKVPSITEIVELLTSILLATEYLTSPDGKLTPDRLLILDHGSVTILPSNDLSADPEFSAPEVLKGSIVPASDIYSIGLIGICLLTGLRPFQLFDISSNSWIWQDYCPNIDPQLATILNQAISLNIDQRFIDSNAMLIALKNSYPQMIRSPSQWSLIHTLQGHEGLFASINEVLVKNSLIISASDDRTMRIWHSESKELITILQGHEKAVKTIVTHPYLPYLFSSGKDGKIILWNLTNFQPILTIDSKQSCINSLVISQDGKLLISGSSDRTLKIWRSDDLTLVNNFRLHELAINQIAINPQPNLVKFATASSDRHVILWNTNQPLTILKAHTKAVKTLTFHPNGQLLATGGDDGYINIWDVHQQKLKNSISAHSWPISRLAFFGEGQYLISTSTDGKLKIWLVNHWRLIDTIIAHEQPILALAIAENNLTLYTASADKTIKIWQKNH